MKRKKGLEKKVKELSILCGVEACMVCFGPQMDQQTTSDYPDVWPGKSKALEIVERYRNLSKEEQAKKKLDNSSFLEQRIKKLKVELSAKRKENRELEMEAVYSWDACLNYFTIDQLKDLVDYIDIRLETANERMNFLSRDEREISNGARQQMEDGGSYNSMMPYQSGHDSSGSTLDHLKPYLSLEGHYKEHMSSCETVAMDYSKANPPFIRAFNDYHAPNYKEAMDNGEDDRMAVCNSHLMVNESFPLLGIDGVNPIQSSTGSCSQWCRTITPCSLHNPLYSTCPQHDGMNPTIQQVQFSCEPHYQQWLDEMMESQTFQRVLGDEGINFQHDSGVRPTPLLLNRSSGSNDHCYIKNIF